MSALDKIKDGKWGRDAAGSGGDHEVLFALMPVKAVYDAGRNGWAVAWKEAHDPAEAWY
eukprot:gene32237-398_t